MMSTAMADIPTMQITARSAGVEAWWVRRSAPHAIAPASAPIAIPPGIAIETLIESPTFAARNSRAEIAGSSAIFGG